MTHDVCGTCAGTGEVVMIGIEGEFDGMGKCRRCKGRGIVPALDVFSESEGDDDEQRCGAV